jgi:hypothetical protein
VFETVTSLSSFDLSKVVLAIGSLGTAAYGVVDASKGFGGGISNRGFGDIKKVIVNLIPAGAPGVPQTAALNLTSALQTLRANWLNGMALGDQKSVAKALVKLNLTLDNAPSMAAATGVDKTVLTSIATKMGTAKPLSPDETDVYGRFDLLLSSLLDQGYQRADQRYRNSAKLLAVFVAIVLAILGGRVVVGSDFFSNGNEFLRAFLAGLLATPLAPVAKDLSSAIQAGAKVAQSWSK